MRFSWSFALVLSVAIAAPVTAQAPTHRESRPIPVLCRDGTRSIVSGRAACTGHGGVRRATPRDRGPKHVAKPQSKHVAKLHPKHAAKPRVSRRVHLRPAKPAESQIRIARDGNPAPCNAKSASTPATRRACAGRTATAAPVKH